MLARQIPVACVQLRAYDRAHFLQRWPDVLATVERACVDGAKLVVLPEGSVPSYVLGDEPVDPALLDRAGRDIAGIARANGTTIVYGGAKIVSGKTFNAAIAVGPSGDELGFSAKQFLWHFDRRWFAAGETLAPIDTPLGRIGLLVCADGRIPTVAATLVERGAQLLVMPTAWVTSGRDPNAFENLQADLMANVRARENRVPFVVANKCGVELESVAYCGKSAIIEASGAFVARAGEREQTVVHGNVSLGPDDRAPRADAAFASANLPVVADARARIAFAFADGPEAQRFSVLARNADADVLVTVGTATASDGGAHIARVALGDRDAADAVKTDPRFAYATIRTETLRSPRGLVAARFAGITLFFARVDDEPEWNVRLARTRAAELRAFIVAFDARHRRAFAVDPDGTVVAGTVDDFRLAAFAYDAARANETTVAPHTDVLAGLRAAETRRAATEAVVA